MLVCMCPQDSLAPGSPTSVQQVKVAPMCNAGQNVEILQDCATVGAATLAAQRIEFLVCGLIAHVKPELKQVDKRFLDLTPEGSLCGDPAEMHAMLGQLARAFGPKFLYSNDLEALVRAGSLIVHDYGRMSSARIRDGRRLKWPAGVLGEISSRLPAMGRNIARGADHHEAELWHVCRQV